MKHTSVAGIAVIVPFDILVDGNFVSPDVGTVTYTLRDNTALPVSGQTTVPVTTTVNQTSVTISITSSYNSKTLTTENRWVDLNFQVAGKAYTLTYAYTLVDYLPIRATEADVRALIGCSYSELPDSDIDLITAFYDLADQTTVASLTAALTGGGRTSMVANRSIAAKAAMLILPSLQLRVNLLEKSDGSSFSRFTKMDWEKLEASLSAISSEIIGVTSPSSSASAVFLFTNLPTDPVTGA
jgi:hypothetical protein